VCVCVCVCLNKICVKFKQNAHMDVLFVYFLVNKCQTCIISKMSHPSLSPPVAAVAGGGMPLRGVPCGCGSGVMTIRERVHRVFEQVLFVVDARQADFVELISGDVVSLDLNARNLQFALFQ